MKWFKRKESEAEREMRAFVAEFREMLPSLKAAHDSAARANEANERKRLTLRAEVILRLMDHEVQRVGIEAVRENVGELSAHARAVADVITPILVKTQEPNNA